MKIYKADAWGVVPIPPGEQDREIIIVDDSVLVGDPEPLILECELCGLPGIPPALEEIYREEAMPGVGDLFLVCGDCLEKFGSM